MNKEDKVELAQWAQGFESRLARLSRKVESASLSPASLRFASVDAEGGISFKDEYGNVIYKLGRGDSGMVEPEYFGGPDPERPGAPFVDYGGEVVKIQHSGLDENEEQGPADHLRTLIYLSQEAEFETGLNTYAGSFSEIDGTMTHRLPGGTWFIAVQWETRSHKLSELSEAVEVEVPPLVDEQDIQDALDEAQARLDEAREEFEQMNQERIDAIQDINDVVLPALEQSLTDAMAELEERVGDVDLSHLESVLAELNETRLPALEATLAGKAESSDLPALEGRLAEAFGEGLDAAVAAASEDATAKADAAREAAEAEAGRLAKAEAEAAKSAAEQVAAQDALEKANAARDAAIESASGDAQEKADAAKEAAETAAAADAKAKADAAQAEAIRQAKLDATAKADAAQAAAEQAAKDHADALPKVLHEHWRTVRDRSERVDLVATSGLPPGAVTAQWNRVGGSWVSTPIDSKAIANLDVGKLTAGGAVISDAVIQDLTASNGAFDRLDAREAWIGDVALEDGAVKARTVDAQEVFANTAVINEVYANAVRAKLLEADEALIGGTLLKDDAVTTRHLVAEAVKAANIDVEELFANEAVVNTVWAEVVRAGLLTAEEALIGGALLEKDSITVDKLTGLEEILTALLRAKKIEAGEIEANALNGMTITGSTLQTVPEASRGIKLRTAQNDLVAYDNSGSQTFRISGTTGDVQMVGEVVAEVPGVPGRAVLGSGVVPPSNTRPGLHLDTGSDADIEPAIFSEATSFAGSWEEGALVLTGREQTANTGRSQLVLNPDGAFRLATEHGSYNTTGFHNYGNGTIGMRGGDPYDMYANDQLFVDRTSTSTGSGDVKWTLTYPAPVPFGERLVNAITLSYISSSNRSAQLGINATSPSAASVAMTDKTSGGTWSLIFWAYWTEYTI